MALMPSTKYSLSQAIKRKADISRFASLTGKPFITRSWPTSPVAPLQKAAVFDMPIVLGRGLFAGEGFDAGSWRGQNDRPTVAYGRGVLV